MKKTVKLRRTVLGAGRPAVAVPVVTHTEAETLEKAREIRAMDADLMEWRCDFFEGMHDHGAVAALIGKLHEALGDIPLLFTFRTEAEGGAAGLPPAEYVALCAAAGGLADAVDVEMLTDEETALRAMEAVQSRGGVVVGSHHRFDGTPSREEMLQKLRRMQEMGADIPKLAVMPGCRRDVLTLLDATLAMYEDYADRPIITMAMAAPGIVSRVACEAFGSCLSFGSLGVASAPGQIPAAELRQTMDILHRALG